MFDKLSLSPLWLLLILYFVVSPVETFEAGNVPEEAKIYGCMWCYGDIANLLLRLPIIFVANYAFNKRDTMQVYFGN
jgi:hypothetical protein